MLTPPLRARARPRARQSLGVAYPLTPSVASMYPTVGLHSKGERVELNFGDAPFAFNVEEEIDRERREMEVEYRERTEIDIMDCHLMVRNYLEHYGYVRTLECFDRLDNRPTAAERDGGGGAGRPGAAGAAPAFLASSSETIAHVRAMVMSGRAREALDLVHEHLPELLQFRHGAVFFALKLQEFIEVLRGGDVAGALRVAREDLAPLRGGDATKDQVMDRAFSLLAFVDPEAAGSAAEGVRGLLRPETRDVVADVFIAAFRAKLREDAARGACKRRKGAPRAGGAAEACEVYLGDGGAAEAGGGAPGAPMEPLHQLLVHLCVVLGEIRDSNGKKHGEPFAIGPFLS